MAMYASAKTGKRHSPADFMPGKKQKQQAEGPGVDVYEAWAKVAKHGA